MLTSLDPMVTFSPAIKAGVRQVIIARFLFLVCALFELHLVPYKHRPFVEERLCPLAPDFNVPHR